MQFKSSDSVTHLAIKELAIGDYGIKKIKFQTVQDANGIMVGYSTIAKTSLERAKLSQEVPDKLKYKRQNRLML
jgi:hypothetical protein